MSSARVVVRVRPFSDEETAKGNTTPIVSVDAKSRVLVLDPARDYKMEKMYPFDGALWSVGTPLEGIPTADQEDTYKTLCEDLVSNTFKGYNNCLLAYGQTGTGKTYTMLGGAGETRGVIPRMCADLIDRAQAARSTGTAQVAMTASYMEVYMEKVYDLLGDTSATLRVRQHPIDGVFVENLAQRPFEDLESLLAILSEGATSRHTAETKLNAHSSRSHAVFTINFECAEKLNEGDQALYGVESNTKKAKLHLVDLAGSEVVSKSGVEGVGFAEATNINKSLMTLGRVIDALSDLGKKVKGAQAPPYRDSTLTFLLSDSVGGNSKTTLVATVSPHITNVDETLNTLRYASRARDIVNAAVTNEDPVVRKIRTLMEDNEKLKRKMNTLRSKTTLASEDMQSEIINLKSENELLKAKGDRQHSGTFRVPTAKKLKAPPKPEPPKPQLVSCLKSQSRVGFTDDRKSPRDKELAKLKDNLKASEKECKKLALKHGKLAAKKEKATVVLSQKKDELSKRISQTDECNVHLAEENDTLLDELQELKYDNQTMSNAMEKLKAQHEDLKASSEQEISDLKGAIDSLEVQKASELEELTRKLQEEKQTELGTLQETLKEVSSNSKVCEARHIKALKHESARSSNVKGRVEELEVENEKLRAQLLPLEEKVRCMQSCVATLHVQRRELVTEEMNEAKIAQLEGEVRSLEERLTSNLEEHLFETSDLRTQLAETKATNRSLAAQADSLKADLKLSYETLAKANTEKGELTRKVLEVQGDCDILTVSQEASEMEVQSLKAALASADKLKQDLLEQVMDRDPQESVESLQKANKDLTQQVQALKAEINGINELQVKVNDLHRHELSTMQREMQREYTAATKRNSLELEATFVSENINLQESVASLTKDRERLQEENSTLKGKLKGKTAVDTTKQDIQQPVGKLNLESTEIKELLESKVAARKKQVLTTVAHVLHRKTLVRCNTFWKWVLWSKEQQYARAETALTTNLSVLEEAHTSELRKVKAQVREGVETLEAKLVQARSKKASAMRRLASAQREAERYKKANASLRKWKAALLEYTSGQADVHLKLLNENALLRKDNKRLDARLTESGESVSDLEAKLQAKALLLQKMEADRTNPSGSMQLELKYLQLREYCLTEMLNTKQAHNCLYLQFEQREYDSMLTHFESHVRGAKKREASIAKKFDTVMGFRDTLYEVYTMLDEDAAAGAVEALVELFSEIRMCYPEGAKVKEQPTHLTVGRCATRSKSPCKNMKRLSMSVSALQASQSTVPLLEEEIMPLHNARTLAQNIVKMQAPFAEPVFSPEQPKVQHVAAPIPPPVTKPKRAPFQELPTNSGHEAPKAKGKRVKKDKCTVM